MNHAVFWVTPMAAVNFVGLLTPFLQFTTCHIAISHFVQTERRIFENGSGLRGELAVIVAGAALPAVVLRQERDVLGTATRALDAVRASAALRCIRGSWSGFGEVLDCFLKGVEYRFHNSILAGIA